MKKMFMRLMSKKGVLNCMSLAVVVAGITSGNNCFLFLGKPKNDVKLNKKSMEELRSFVRSYSNER